MMADPLVCGSHSNIPLCCQMFFDSCWLKLRETTLPKGGAVEIGNDVIEFAGDWMVAGGVYNRLNRYIMCPDCIVRYFEGRFTPHKVKDCDCAKK